MNIFKVVYEPNLSTVTRSYIRDTMTPSMTSQDGTSNQYELDFVLTQIEDDKAEIPQDDLQHLRDLLCGEDVNYIEI